MTTGESANGRSISALSRPRPGKRRRTSASAVMTPKTVLMGTAMRVIVMVSQKACWKSGDRSAARTGVEAVLERAHRRPARPAARAAAPGSSRPIEADGQRGQRRPKRTRRSRCLAAADPDGDREHAVRVRRARAAVTARPPRRACAGGGRGPSRRARSARSTSSTTRDRRRAAGSSFSIWLKIVDRGDLGLERDVAGDEHDRAELADRARERQAARRSGSPAAGSAG